MGDSTQSVGFKISSGSGDLDQYRSVSATPENMSAVNIIGPNPSQPDGLGGEDFAD